MASAETAWKIGPKATERRTTRERAYCLAPRKEGSCPSELRCPVSTKLKCWRIGGAIYFTVNTSFKGRGTSLSIRSLFQGRYDDREIDVSQEAFLPSPLSRSIHVISPAELDRFGDDSLPVCGHCQTKLAGFLHSSLRLLPVDPCVTAGLRLIMELCPSLSNAIFIRIGRVGKTGFQLSEHENL